MSKLAMSRTAKSVGTAALIAGALMLAAGSAQAQHRWHHHRGSGVYFSFGAPYAYVPPPYYYGPDCRYERYRYWRHGRWHWRTVRRCY